MNMEMTEKQKRGIELLNKGLKRKFPFIVDLKIDNVGKYHLWSIITVEFTRFLKFYNVPTSDFHIDRGLELTKDYFESFGKAHYLFILVDDGYFDKFRQNYNDKLEYFINGLYGALPDEYKIIDDGRTKEIKIDNFIVEVDVDGEFPTHTNS